MKREAIGNFQISPNETKNIMQAIARIKPATLSLNKSVIRLVFGIASAILIVLILGIDSQNSLNVQSEMIVETVNAPVAQNLEGKSEILNQVGVQSDEENKDGDNRKKSNQVLDDQGDFTKWALPENATARFGKGRIIQMQYSPDDTQLAVATPIGIWIYDAQSGEELNLLTGHRSEVYSVAYSSDGSTIATGAWDGVKLWDAVTGDLKTTIKANAIRSMTFSPDGSTIVTGSNHGSVHFWDVATGLSKAEFTGHTSIVSSIAYSPDLSTVATASEDDTVRLWDVATGQTKATLTGHTDWVTSVNYSPDGLTIATASLDDTVRLWDAISGNHIATLTGHKHYAMSVEYSPAGNTIASRGWDGIIFWHVDVENDEAIFIGRIPKVSSLTYSSDGATIAVGGNDGTAYLYDAADVEVNSELGQRLEGQSLFSGHKRWANCVTYSPDGTIIVTGNTDGVHLWDATTGQFKATYKGHTDTVHSVAFSPNGTAIVGGSWDGKVHLWNANTGQYKRLEIENDSQSSSVNSRGYITRRDHVTSTIYSPDGTTIASAIDENTIRLWDIATGKQINSFTGHTDLIHSIAFSPDGTTIASVSRDKTVRLWDVATRKHKTTLVGHTDGVYSVAYSPDGTTIATGAWYGDSMVRLWVAATGTPKTSLRNQGVVLSMAYSLDGTTLATADSSDIRLWDTATGILKKTLTGHKGRIESLVFSPDGNTIATVSMDGTMILWNVAPTE